MSGKDMSDVFSRYARIYEKSKAKEVVPPGAFTRQFVDIPHQGLDVGIFFKSRRSKDPRQIYINNPILAEISKHEGLLEVENKTYLSRTILKNVKGLQYLRVVVGAGRLLDSGSDRINFLKKCQRIIDVLIRKAKNIVHQGDFSPFRVDKKIKTLKTFLEKDLKFDEVTSEAASIPFVMANPDYILLTGDDMIIIDDVPAIPYVIYYIVGGIGYRFDKTIGAVHEERLFRVGHNLESLGIDEAYSETMISRVTADFQNNVHSLIFADIWRKSTAQPLGVGFSDLLIKIGPESDIWSGVFEVYVRPPKT
ncbi:MAG: hypothetical protein ACTSYL_03695 [Candidatus Thorarchaeota archaeon]